MRRTRLLTVSLFILLGMTIYGGRGGWPAGAQGTGPTTPASVALAGRQGNSYPASAAIFGDERAIAFEAKAGNPRPGDPNGDGEIFAHDQGAASTITTTLGGLVADAESGQVITGAMVNLYRVPMAQSDTLTQTKDCRTVETRPSSSGDPFGPWSGLPGMPLRPDWWVDPATSTISNTAVISPAVNPQTTGPDGAYGWEVAEGCWYIKVSAAGYQSLVSPLVGAPPAATDLNVELQPVRASLYLPQVVLGNITRTIRVSVAFDGTQANADSLNPALSDDGRYVAFSSEASNLVPGDTNGTQNVHDGVDIFVYGRQTGQTTRVSVASDGTQANESSYRPALSGDGRYVAFSSGADNLVPDDTNEAADIFVHDRQTSQTTRVNVASDGSQAMGGILGSGDPVLSGDGRYVVFSSEADNLVPGDTNEAADIFVHDLGAE